MKHINDFGEFLNGYVNLSQAKIDKLEEKIGILDSEMSKSLAGYVKYEKQGSFALRTMIRPVQENDEVDADLLVFMNEKIGWNARDYIDALHKVFREHGNYRDIVRRKTRCVTIDYQADFHVDLVPAIEKSDGIYICNYDDNGFEKTDGTGLREWFNAKSKATTGELKRVTRLIKFLRDHKDNFSVKSVLLSVLLGNCVYGSDSFGDIDTATVLKAIMERLHQFLSANPTMPTITNPALPSENFNRHWDQTKYSNFREKVRIYWEKIEEAYKEQDRNESIRKWQKLFGNNFGTIGQQNGSKGNETIVPRKPYAHE